MYAIRSYYDNITLVRVPGAVEIPLAVKRLAASQKFDAIVALGCVIRGGTAHFEYVAGECAKGLAQVSRITSYNVCYTKLLR